jgi:hypothetical protein
MWQFSREQKVAGLILAIGLIAIVYNSIPSRSSTPALGISTRLEVTPTPDTSRVIPTPRPTTQAQAEAELLAKRKAYIVTHERVMLDEGFDFYLSLRGKKQDELVVKYVLISRVWVHQFRQKYPAFFQGLRDLGFRKAHFTDGYDETWTFDL